MQRAAILGSIALFCGAAIAGRAAPAEPDFFARTWTTDDGLPHNSASRALQDAAGFMWFSTVGGLARFDGREFLEFRVPAALASGGYNIRGLAEERPGTLILLPTSGQVVRLSGTEWSHHPVSKTLNGLGDSAAAVHVDSDGDLWVGTMGGRLIRWQPDGASEVFALDRPPGSSPPGFYFAADAEGATWISSQSYLAVYRNGKFTRHPQTPAGSILIAPGMEGRIWVCAEHRLLRLERGHLTVESTDSAWQDVGVIRHLFEGSRGDLWVASSRRGLLRYAQGRLAAVATPYSTVSHITGDREGSLWVTTDGTGVGQIREKAYRSYDRAAGLEQDGISSISEDSTGRVWLANRPGGIVFLTPEGALPPRDQQFGPRVFSNVVCVDHEDRLWFGGGRNRLQRWQPGSTDAPELLRIFEGALHLLFCAANGDMWFAADAGVLGYYRQNEVRIFSSAEGFSSMAVRAIAQDPSRDIWLGGLNGQLLRWDGKHFETFDRARGFPSFPIHTIAADAAGRIWVGTTEGLVLKDGQNFYHLTPAHGLADNIIHHMIEDDDERLWFASRRGLFYAAKAELLLAARHGTQLVVSHLFGRDQGLNALTPIANYFPAVRKTRDGKLWFATAQGAVAVDPKRLSHRLPVPPVVIDEVRLDDHVAPPHGALLVPSGRHRLEFRFAVLTYTAPEAVELRHQLEGADPVWVKTPADRTASYAGLGPGEYRLRVIAKNSTGQWNTEGASMTFTVVPAWWETWPARSGAIIVLVGMSAWIARTVSRRRMAGRLRLLEQENALEKERVRIARDLHDDLGAGLTGVGMLADRLAATPVNELGPQLAGLAQRTRRLSTDLSGIVWTMSPRNSTLDRLGEFLRQYAQRVFRDAAITCAVKGVQSLPALPIAPHAQHQLIAATKEAINNILKHSQATAAVLALRCDLGFFEIVISDDGVGFAPSITDQAEGNGLRNMRSRTAEIGGTVAITSEPGAGTQVALRVPLTPHSGKE